MDIFQRIKNRRIELNMSQEDLAEKTGYKTKGAISRIESGYRDINQSQIEIFAKALDVSPEYLLLGVQSNKYNTADDYIEERLNIPKTKLLFYDNICVNCSSPIIPEYSDIDVQEIELPNAILGDIAGKSNLVAIKSRGDSMDEIIPEGSLVIIQKILPFDNVQDGDIVMYSFEDCWSIKEFIKKDDCVIFRPHSTNPRHKDNIYKFSDMEDGMDIPKIIGKVVYYGVSL